MNPAKWLQTATSTTKLTHSIYFAPSSLGADWFCINCAETKPTGVSFDEQVKLNISNDREQVKITQSLSLKVSERSERDLMKTRSMNPGKWLLTATSTTKLYIPTFFFSLHSFCSCFIKNAPRFARCSSKSPNSSQRTPKFKPTTSSRLTYPTATPRTRLEFEPHHTTPSRSASFTKP